MSPKHPNQKDMTNGSSYTGTAGMEIIPDVTHLRSYTQRKLALGDLLRITHKGFITLGRKTAEEQCQDLLVKLAEDRFTLAVVGQFKRGKSSLMNAIIGRDILPTGVLPLTSAITVLRYGTKERLIVDREDALYPSEAPVAELPGYVTEKGNPLNEKKVKTVYLELPVPFLRYGLEFVDTPGVGSAIAANTATTFNFLPSCDAVLFVTSVDTPITAAELEFLNTIQEYVHKIFFIVNKIDLVAGNERKEVLDFVTRSVQSNTGIRIDRVFAVSCQAALAAKISGNTGTYEASGLKTLEDALAQFLSGEKSAVFLSAMAQKAARIIDGETVQGSFTATHLQERAAAIMAEKVRTIHEDPHDAALIIAKAGNAFHQFMINGGIKAGKDDTSASYVKANQQEDDVSSAGDVSMQTTRQMKKINLEADLQARGCAVCGHVADQAFDFFANWQYRLSGNEQAQEAFAAGIAFCPLHTWQLLSISSPQGASVGYARLAEEVAHRLKANDPALIKGAQIRQWIHNASNCPACLFLRQAEQSNTCSN